MSRLRHGAVLAVAVLAVTGCDPGAEEPTPDPLPAICGVVSDAGARAAIGTGDDVAIERQRDDGDVSCRYVADEPGLPALIATIDPASATAPERVVADLLSSCPEAMSVDDLPATYCPNDDSEISGPYLAVVAGDRVVTLTLTISSGIDGSTARDGLTRAARDVVDNADRL